MSKAKIVIKKLSSKDYGDKIVNCLKIEDAKKVLRQLRANECFSVTDRPIWYNKLPDWQKKELTEWYEDWLKVTETFKIPEKPKWIN